MWHSKMLLLAGCSECATWPSLVGILASLVEKTCCAGALVAVPITFAQV